MDYDLPKLQSEFKTSGVVVVRALFSQREMQTYATEAAKLWDSYAQPCANNLRFGIRKNQDGGDVLERLDPVMDISEIFAALNDDTRIVSIVETLFGEPVSVMKEKLIYKWPGTSGYGPHRDENYFGGSGASGADMVSASLALDPANAENGAIKFYPKLRLQSLDAPQHEPRDIAACELENREYYRPDLRPGDMVFFDGLIPHCSDFNRSLQSRRTYMITYVPARYENGREKYYRCRMAELRTERAAHHYGQLYFS